MQASFQRPEGYSVCHQALMPQVPDPESLPTEEQRFKNLLHDPEIQPLAKWILKHRQGCWNSALTLSSIFWTCYWVQPGRNSSIRLMSALFLMRSIGLGLSQYGADLILRFHGKALSQGFGGFG
ncbi:Acot8 [Symbiodinium natans]|uniref:Acot8 protein n=1 Tax=Symbiodinium natans TaxID=878477 RepID=A0A812M7S7_9DINO|nr:Acot8 [Symbiodinium natans]